MLQRSIFIVRCVFDNRLLFLVQKFLPVSQRLVFTADVYQRVELIGLNNYSLSVKMALCVPKVMILGRSFVRRLLCDLERQFDDRAKRDFDLGEVNVRLFGFGGRTVAKLNQI